MLSGVKVVIESKSIGEKGLLRPGPEVINLFSCSVQLSINFFPAYKC